MTNQSTKDILVTIPFDELVVVLLGEERRGYRSVPPTIAGVLEWHIKSDKLETLYKVQYEHIQEVDRFEVYQESKLEWPIFWAYQDWYDDQQNWNRRKANAESRRVERLVEHANVKLIAKAYREFTGVESIESSEAMAYSLLKGGKIKSITAMGVERLITSEKEIR